MLFAIYPSRIKSAGSCDVRFLVGMETTGMHIALCDVDAYLADKASQSLVDVERKWFVVSMHYSDPCETLSLHCRQEQSLSDVGK